MPVLEYATRNPSRLKRWLIRGSLLVAAVGVVYLVGRPREPAMAVRESLQELDALASESPNLSLSARRSIYARLLKCKTRDDVRRILIKLDVHQYEE